jgi:putative transposase
VFRHGRIGQEQWAIKRRIRPTSGFKAMSSARVILQGAEVIHMMSKQQHTKYAGNGQRSFAENFEQLAA